MRLMIALSALFVLVSFIGCKDAPVSDKDYIVEEYLTGIDVPWAMDWLPNGDMLITDRSGTLYRYDGKDLSSISGAPEVLASGQGGLLDVKVHPNYSDNGWVYLTYSSVEGGSGSNTAIMRAKIEGNELVAHEVIYKASPNSNMRHHYGSRLAFDNDGYLYFSVGDRGARDENPQDITKDGGKIYRIYDDGRIPSDNPFVNEEGAKTAIFSYGHRNPQGMVKNPLTGKIWTHEHGPKGGDEINVIAAGKNYGWPVISFGINYDGTIFTTDTAKVGMEQPQWYWVPSIAPSGMTFITSSIYPDWKGDVIVGSLSFAYLVLCDVNGDEVTNATVLFEGIGRTRDVRQGPDGYIYVAVEGQGIKRIVPKS